MLSSRNAFCSIIKCYIFTSQRGTLCLHIISCSFSLDQCRRRENWHLLCLFVAKIKKTRYWRRWARVKPPHQFTLHHVSLPSVCCRLAAWRAFCFFLASFRFCFSSLYLHNDVSPSVKERENQLSTDQRTLCGCEW